MKRSILALLFCLSLFSHAYTKQHTWTETCPRDFEDGDFQDVVISTIGIQDGGLQLKHPLVKKTDDVLIHNLTRYVAHDSAGNCLKVFRENDILYARRFDKNDNAIEEAFQVNDAGSRVHAALQNKIAAFLNNGAFCIAWLQDKEVFAKVYNSEGVQQGNKFIIGKSGMASWLMPSIYADNETQRFNIVFSQRWDIVDINIFKLYHQSIHYPTLSLDNYTRVHEDTTNCSEVLHSLAFNGHNSVALVWVNTDSAIIRYFNTKLEPKSSKPISIHSLAKTMEGINYYGIGEPSICFDKESRLLATWADCSDYSACIYAQLIDSNAVQIRERFQVSDAMDYSRKPEAVFDSGRYKISWEVSMQTPDDVLYEIYQNQWQIESVDHGQYTSGVFDAGISGVNFTTIQLSGQQRDHTQMRCQLRTAQTITDIEGVSWYGPFSTQDAYDAFDTLFSVNAVHNPARYVQYQIILETEALNQTPVLDQISLSFSSLDTISPNPPANIEVTPGPSEITLKWGASSDDDIWQYIIYRETTASDSVWTHTIYHPDTMYVDKAVQNKTAYTYSFKAVDLNHNESVLSEEFTAIPLTQIIYVNDESSNGDGSIDHPFDTITEAVTHAGLYDTVRVMPGFYDENILLNKKLTLIGSGADHTVISAATSNDYSAVVDMRDAKEVSGFKIIKKGAWMSAVSCSESNCKITDNLIVNEGSGDNEGISIRSSGCLVLNNIITGFTTGIRFFSSQNWLSPGAAPVCSLMNNIIYTDSSPQQYGILLYLTSKGYCHITNNVIYTYSTGIWCRPHLDLDKDMINIYNNIIVSIAGRGIDFSRSSEFNYDYNTIFTKPDMAYLNASVQEHDILIDPCFENAEAWDFRLKEISPCIDAGHPDSQYNDLDGSRNDMGIFGGSIPMPSERIITPVIRVEAANRSGFPGDTIEIPITLSNAASLKEVRMTVAYNPEVIDVISVNTTLLTKDFILNYEEKSKGELNVHLISSAGLQKGKGDIVNIQFQISKEATKNDVSSLLLKSIQLVNVSEEPFHISEIVHGGFTVNPQNSASRFIYVDANVDVDGDGTIVSPFKTIQQGVNAASSGDTVFVYGGNYREQVIMRNNVYLLGAGSLVSTITLGEEHTPDLSEVVQFHNVQGSGIEGFTLKMNGNQFRDIISCRYSNPVIRKNCIVCPEEVNGAGVSVFYSSPEIINNYFLNDESAFQILAVECTKSVPHIGGNTFNIQRNEFSTTVEVTDSSQVHIENNVFQVSGQSDIINFNHSSAIVQNNQFNLLHSGLNAVTGKDIYLSEFKNNIFNSEIDNASGILIENGNWVNIVNNVFATTGYGLNIKGDNIQVFNNIFSGNHLYGMSNQKNCDLAYNDFWQNQIDFQGCESREGNLNVDPKFLEYYYLSENSPCIDAGLPDLEYRDPDGSRNDMGAYGGPGAAIWNEQTPGVEIEMAETTAFPGDTINLSVHANFIQNMAKTCFLLEYNPEFSNILNAWPGQICEGFNCLKKDSTENKVKIELNRFSLPADTNGILLTLQVFIQQNAHPDSILHFDFDHVEMIDEVTMPIKVFNVANGKVKVVASGIHSQCQVPEKYYLYQNYPNPFNPQTAIRYQIPGMGEVSIVIYNLLGQEVIQLVDAKQKAGSYEIIWNGLSNSGTFVGSGMYLMVMQAGKFRQIRKMMVIH